jgi:hypothetical protein
MTDDLVEKARHYANADVPHYASISLIVEMADRIQKLEAKLAQAVEALGDALSLVPDDEGPEIDFIRATLAELEPKP